MPTRTSGTPLEIGGFSRPTTPGEWGNWDDEDSGEHEWGDDEGPGHFEQNCTDNDDGVKECTFDDGEWACVTLFADGFRPTYEACESADGTESFVCTRDAASPEVSCSYTFGEDTCEEVFTPWELIESTCEEGSSEENPLP